MLITVIAEPRSGSTNLAIWFSCVKSFTVLFEPTNPTIDDNNEFIDTLPINWKYNTEHLLVKEIYTENNSIQSELVKISNKVIVLYREDKISQFESWNHAMFTKEWDARWVYKPTLSDEETKNMHNAFLELMSGFKNEYIDNSDFFKISYEELYYNNGFQRILDYIDLPEVQNIGFPYGAKYRVDAIHSKLI
jgi:hypothetical protein